MRVRAALVLPLSLPFGLALSLAGCGAGARPSQGARLASPLLGGARLEPAWATPSPADAPGDRPDRGRRPAASAVASSRAPTPRLPLPAITRPGRGPAVAISRPGDDLPPCAEAAPGAPCSVRPPDTLDLASLPERHRAPTAAPGGLVDAVREPADLRRLVGLRFESDPVAFALVAATRLAGIDRPDVADGPALVAWAAAHERAAGPDREPGPGDLLVFDRVVKRAPASLVAVVVGRDDRGVHEMIYLAGGVVRRGFVDARRPRTGRDGERRIVNSYLRHNKEWPPEGTRFLAGELLAHVIRLR